MLPDAISDRILHKLYYGHFFCHVFHQDYIVAKDHDPVEIEHQMCLLLDKRNARYPAEHNIGHPHKASPSQQDHFQGLDPRNCFNPGIGLTSRKAEWV